MQDTFTPPTIPATDHNQPPPCPRRLLNDRLYLERAEDLKQAPMTATRKMRLRYNHAPGVLVNDAGMVRGPAITGAST